MDPMDDFEFKPLTEGLGFHKKAQDVRPKAEPKLERTEQEKLSRASIMESPAPRSFALDDDRAATPAQDRSRESSRDSSRDRAPSKSISDLIASLPPSLDFTESTKEDSAETSRPQIFQPLAREDYKPSFANATKKPEAPRFEMKPEMRPEMRPDARVEKRSEARMEPRPNPTLGQVLPPPGSKVNSPTVAAIAAPLVGSAPKSSPYRASMDESLARAFPHAVARSNEPTTAAATTPEKKAVVTEAGLVPVPANFGAGLLDAMVVTGMSTVFLVIILFITKANLWGLLSNAQTDGPTQMHLVLLFLAVLQLYMLTARSFFGASLGEWAFDLQLGSNQEQVSAVYPLKVAWRTLVVTVTGLVVLPLASLLMKRDLTRSITGLQLYHRP